HRRDFLAQRRRGARAQVAFEVEDEEARFRVAVLAARLLLTLALLLPGLERLLVAALALDRELQPVRGVLELSIQVLDDEPFCVSTAPRRSDEDDDDDEYKREGRELGEEQSIRGEKFAHLRGQADVVLLEHA